ncbi:MAG: MATE family efflux transporter [Methanobacteriaceae archaeon]|nr:MATE family efflux transporter [Methanobacteriaceae archaeon]
MAEKIESENLDLIQNNPKKAIRVMSIPVALSVFFLILNSLIDTAWVSGLGPQALAAVGFITPLSMALAGFGTGLGAGANSVIARYIGADNLKRANNSGTHSVVLVLWIVIILTILLFIFKDNVLLALGAKDVMDWGRPFIFWVIIGLFSVILPGVFGGILRSNGEVKRATYPLITAAFVNMVIDPIFIYTLDFGISGASLATTLAQTIFGLCPMIYWLFIKKDNVVKINLKDFKRDMSIYKDILVIGIPASLEEFVMALLSAIVNGILVITAGTAGVAVFSAAWRLIGIGVTPAIGVGTAAVTVIGAAYGAKNWDNLKTAFNSAIEMSLWLSLAVCVIFYIFAGDLASLFAFTPKNAVLAPQIAEAIRILSLYIVVVPFGLVATFFLQGVGKGVKSLILTFIRELIFVVLGVSFFVFVMDWGTNGVYVGMIIGALIGSLIAYWVAKRDMFKIIKKG